MAYDLEEQEKLADLKAWWKRYGNLVTWAVIIVLAAYAAWTFWGNYQRGQAEQASQLYYEMENAVRSRDNQRAQRIAADMQEKFGKTVYAAMTGLVAARMAADANEPDVAKSRLKWVVEQSKGEGYKAIARIRLAGLLMDEKKYDEAQSMLAAEFPEAFAGIAEDRRGDVYYAQGKLDEAKKAYRTALAKSAAEDPGRSLIQLKLDDLGGGTAKTEKG
ncbi:MAG: tetratricopeptide repeat protein [Burkholderiaceae bacterium]|jgi:predicted negative regulator of RcsB-dependent stress response|nr:tetratricopeptide repeat protein [Burkholderiaceae bacterium]